MLTQAKGGGVLLTFTDKTGFKMTKICVRNTRMIPYLTDDLKKKDTKIQAQNYFIVTDN